MDYEAMAQQRIDYAKKNAGDIVIAAIQDADHNQYIRGITLAAEEINQSKGLLGRSVILSIHQGTNDFRSAKSMIRQIANNPKVSIVLGHSSDEVVLPASMIYEKSKLLFFPPLSTTKKLTSHGYLFTFRMVPDNIHMAEQICEEIKNHDYKDLAVLYSRTEQQRELALLFKKATTPHNLNVAFNYSFFAGTMDFHPFLSDLKKKEFDAILLSADVKTAARLVSQMSEMGIDKPIFASADLNDQTFKLAVGITKHKTAVPTPLSSSTNNGVRQHFVTQYRKKYNQEPNADAAQGYDSVMLFADKVIKAQTTLPDRLASTVRFSPSWTGVTGKYHFDKEGDLINKQYFFQLLN